VLQVAALQKPYFKASGIGKIAQRPARRISAARAH
jgi:hypothetical protein